MKVSKKIALSDALSFFAIIISLFSIWYSYQGGLDSRRENIARIFIEDWSDTSIEMERLFCFKLVAQGVDRKKEIIEQKNDDPLLAGGLEERKIIAEFSEGYTTLSNEEMDVILSELLKARSGTKVTVYKKMVEIAEAATKEKIQEAERVCGPMFN